MQQRQQQPDSPFLVYLKQLKSRNIDLNNPIDSEELLKLERINRDFAKKAKDRGYNYLHAVIELQDYEATKFLVIECKVDVNKVATIRPIWEPLFLATFGVGELHTSQDGKPIFRWENRMNSRQKQIYTLLVAVGAKPIGDHTKTFLDRAISAGMFNGADFTRYKKELLDDQKELAKKHPSLLHAAVRNISVSSDSSLQAQLKQKSFPHLIVQENLKKIENLITEGADVTETIYGGTLLHLAVENKSLQCLELLLANKNITPLIVNTKNWNQKTALDLMHDAIKEKSLQNISEEWKSIIDLLVGNGALFSGEQQKDFLTIGIDTLKARAEFQLNVDARVRSEEARNNAIIADQQEQRSLTNELVVAVDGDFKRHEFIMGEQTRSMMSMEQEMIRQRRMIESLASENERIKALMLENTPTRLALPLPQSAAIAQTRVLSLYGSNSNTFFPQPREEDTVSIPRSEWEEWKREMGSLKNEVSSLKERVRQLEGNEESLDFTSGNRVGV